MHRIAKTGFYVSLISYLLFWLFDSLRPGFVARSFSVHLFLLGAIGFGIWWGFIVKEYSDRPWAQLLVALILGMGLTVITWVFGEGLGAVRLLIAVTALFIPLLFWRLIRE